MRQYHKISDEQRALVEEWFRARAKLGTQKEFAYRSGISVERIQAIVAKIRRGKTQENL